MLEIDSFVFDNSGIERVQKLKYGVDWPIVYIIENGTAMYVGETIRACGRMKEHLENEKRKNLDRIHIISDDEFNKSATLDTESSLIEYLVADGKYKLQNGNAGLKNHQYFDREKYKGKFEVLWEKLREMNIAEHNLLEIRNSSLFKYSPYKTLTDDQYFIAHKILEKIEREEPGAAIVHGGPGTGKTILATYLIKQLVEKGNDNVALVIAMTSLRQTLKKVFKNINGLKPSMVIGPNDVKDKTYDVLVVDESHRLRRRKGIVNYKSFDDTNKAFGLDNEGTELDWILRSAKNVVLFFDEKQTVRPSDINPGKVHSSSSEVYHLNSQIRVKGGEKYLEFIDAILENQPEKIVNFENYDFQLFEDLDEMVNAIKNKEKIHSLCRMVAGYAWSWVSRKNKSTPDITIGNTKLFWNSQTIDWVNSPNAINEVGCIHTIQGYDLNYAGVIVGPEISFDPVTEKIVVNKDLYQDSNGHRGVTDPEELRRYIINIYKTLMTRGILGTYVYIVDDHLRSYFQKFI